MSIFLRRERVCSAGGGAFALSIAENQSGSPDPACAYQQVIDVAERVATPLAEPMLKHGASGVAGAARAPLAALAVDPSGPRGVVYLIDVARRKVARELTPPGPFLHMALDAAGARVAYVLIDRVVVVDVASGREVVSVAHEAGRRFAGHVTHCEGYWVVVSSSGRTWLGTVLTDDGAFTGRVHAMRGEPVEMCGASAAPVIACSVGRKLVQVIEVVTGASIVIAAHPAKDAFGLVSVAISDDGRRVFSRGSDDRRLCMLARGGKSASELRAMPPTTRHMGGREYLTQPGLAVCGEALVTVSEGVATFEPFPAVKIGASWAANMRRRR